MEHLSNTALGLVPTVRTSQVRMAEIVQDVLANGGVALVQAGTGVGKSLAYLVPAVLSGKRVVISTAMKSLQDQLAHVDLPKVSSKVKPFTWEVFKGRGNYVCRLRLEEQLLKEYPLYPRQQLEALEAWARESDTGLFSELQAALPFEHAVRITECHGDRCAQSNVCSFRKTRVKGRSAEILVVNHSMLAQDLRLGRGRLFGEYDALIIDEAHKAPDFFRSAYTTEMTVKQLDALKHAVDENDTAFIQVNQGLRQMFGTLENTKPGVLQWNQEQQVVLKRIQGACAELAKTYGEPGLPDGFADTRAAAGMAPASAAEMVSAERLLSKGKAERAVAAQLIDQIKRTAASALEPKPETVVYLARTEDRKHSWVRAAPLEVGPLVGPALASVGSLVLTSATLATSDGFNWICREVGIFPSRPRIKEVLSSPFPYKTQSIAYVSPTAPEFNFEEKDRWNVQVGTEMHELIEASQGGAFVLCSSKYDMRAFCSYLTNKRSPNYQVQQQGDEPLAPKVAWFKAGYNRVLIGVDSLWEGVDVPGLRLRLVIIPRLKFVPPDDVISGTRKNREAELISNEQDVPFEKAKKQLFMKYDVPRAGIIITQGAGRLFRTERDWGVVVFLDPRMRPRGKGYTGLLRGLLPHPFTEEKKNALWMLQQGAKFAKQEEASGRYRGDTAADLEEGS
jgi:ATP-dependent DNA helicase DinG